MTAKRVFYLSFAFKTLSDIISITTMSDSPIKDYTSLPSALWSQAVGDLAVYLKHTNGRVHTCYHTAFEKAIATKVSEAPVWRALAGPFNANGRAFIAWGNLASLDRRGNGMVLFETEHAKYFVLSVGINLCEGGIEIHEHTGGDITEWGISLDNNRAELDWCESIMCGEHPSLRSQGAYRSSYERAQMHMKENRGLLRFLHEEKTAQCLAKQTSPRRSPEELRRVIREMKAKNKRKAQVTTEAAAKKAKQSHPTAAEISEANRLLQAFVGPTTLEVAQAANETAKEIVKASVPKFKVTE